VRSPAKRCASARGTGGSQREAHHRAVAATPELYHFITEFRFHDWLEITGDYRRLPLITCFAFSSPIANGQKHAGRMPALPGI
jgi:hypothetical protein